MQEPVRVSGSEIAARMLARIARDHAPNTRELVGFVAANDPSGMSFQKAKRAAAEHAGIPYRIAALPESISQEEAAHVISAAVADRTVGGIVIQLPLMHLDAQQLLDLVPIGKDPDVLGAEALARLHTGAGVLPPAVRATEIICEETGLDLTTATVAVVGLGRLVGQPIADWLENRCARLVRWDIGFDEHQLAEADLVILGTGAYTLDSSLLKEGAGVIDFGYRRTETGLQGDLDVSNLDALSRLAFYTPTPGGTGPVLVAALMENFARLNDVDGTGFEPVTSSV